MMVTDDDVCPNSDHVALSIILLTEPPNNSAVKAELQTLPSRGDVRMKAGDLGEACTCSAYKPQDPNPYLKPQCKFRLFCWKTFPGV